MRIAAALAVGAALAAAPAQAAVLPGQTVDTAIVSAQDVSLAADGTGAVAYVKEDNGVDQAFVVRRSGGAWGPPQKVSNSLQDIAEVQVEASNGGRVLVVFRSATQDLTARVSPGTGQPYSNFIPIATGPDTFDSDANDSGVGYIVTTDMATGDVRAWRVTGATATPIGTPLDATAGNIAGDATRAIAVDGAGNALAAFDEDEGGQPTRIFTRRLAGLTPGPAVEATVPSLGGTLRAPVANNVDVDSDLAGNFWVAFREQFAYATNRLRPLARRFSGGAFGPAFLLDPGPTPPAAGTDAEFTRLAVAPNGAHALASGFIQNINTNKPPLFGASLTPGGASPFALEPSPSDGAIRSANGIVNGGTGFIAYSFQPGAAANYVVRARLRSGTGAFAAPIAVSDPALGQVDGASTPFAAADASKTGVVAYSQGAAAQKRILVATLDLPVPVPAPGGDKVAPAISRFSLSRRTFRKGSKLPRLSARKFKTGTTIRFRLSEAATVRLTFERAAKGRKVGRSCRKPSRKNRRRKACTRYVRVKTTLSVKGKAGANRIAFQGRLTRRRSLRTGRYRFSLRATDASRNSSKRTAKKRFRLLRAAAKKKP